MAASPFCVYYEWCTRCKSRDTCPDIPVWLKNEVSSHSYIGHWFYIGRDKEKCTLECKIVNIFLPVNCTDLGSITLKK